MVDITPVIPAGRRLIQGYGDGRFRISGVVYEGSVLVFPSSVAAWSIIDPSAVTVETLGPVLEPERRVQILLLGCGPRGTAVAPDLRQTLRRAGIIVEAMDTGAACRTYNVLMAEDRPVAAALIAV
ncbi:MAG: Mth938-like domain-containing protein [Alphaproteobacteria bacterium]|nr:Mth938-like domain-containing protein [Alphaproteobacteria bacterium]